MTISKKVELLAPAKNLAFGKIAINYGADAVYIGGSDYGARSQASNCFTDIEQLIIYAHKFNVKVYVAVNTVLFDEEIPKAADLIRKLYLSGCDGVIIQDFGLLEYGLPPIPLIASTQMFAGSVEKILFLEKIGFSRVVLPRELSISEIQYLRGKVSIELESFIHGALCVSQSGRCYLSYAIGGRSGNRGECAQPCRKKYSLHRSNGDLINRDKYLLSLKDINFTSHIGDLLEAGVRSFKIEGRLKDEVYLKTTVSHYRSAIDLILTDKNMSKESSGVTHFDFISDIRKSYNRGFTDYFLVNRKKDITAFDSPKSIGELIGTVKKIVGKSFILDGGSRNLQPGDGIAFFCNGELTGTNINTVKGEIIGPRSIDGIQIGVRIYRNHDIAYDNLLSKSKSQRKIQINMKLSVSEDLVLLHVIDEDEITSEVTIPNTFQIAEIPEKALEQIHTNLQKLGTTDYKSVSVEIEAKIPVFIPISEINNLRRKAIQKLDEQRIINLHDQYIEERSNLVQLSRIVDPNVKYPYKELNYDENVINSYALRFYQKHGVSVLEMGAESGVSMNGKVVMTTKHCLRYSQGSCLKNGEADDDLYITDDRGKRYPLEFDCDKCVMKIIF